MHRKDDTHLSSDRDSSWKIRRCVRSMFPRFCKKMRIGGFSLASKLVLDHSSMSSECLNK